MAPRVPAATNRFVGRTAQTTAVDAALRTARLVTITGAGGVGKTRLALEVARRRARRRLATVFVDLSSISEPRLASAAFADAVGLPGFHGEAMSEVVRFLGDAKTLVVVDNCEHMIEAAAAAVVSLLEGCPRLRVLATSREALRVPGEVVCALGPMPAEEAVRLFVERAEAVRAGAATGADGAIEAICARLDGLPLALELAAARASVLDPQTILARLDDRLGTLRAAGRGVPARHRSLLATIEWSVDLLSDEERRSFARLGVFPGTFSLPAADAVGDVGVDLLESLVTKSLVMVLAAGDHGLRYRMLDTLRSYARRLLDASGESDDLRARHLAFFVARGEEVHAASAMGGSQADVAALSEELDNLRAALAWSVDHAPAAGLCLIGTSRQVWYRGGQSEGREWAVRLLERHPEADRARALGLLAVGQLTVAHQEHDAARPLLFEAAELAHRLGDVAIGAGACHYLGVSGMLSRDLEGAERAIARSIELFADLGQAQGIGRGTGVLGMIRLYQRRLPDAERLLADALDILSGSDDSWGRGQALLGLGLTAKAAGDRPAAIEHLTEAITTLARTGDATILGVAMSTLAGLTFSDDPVRALRLAGAAVGFRERTGGGYPPATVEELEGLKRLGVETLGAERADREWRAGRRLDPAQSTTILEPAGVPDTPALLTARQLEIARLVADGLSNAEIAAALHLSGRTVENHVFNALGALDLHNRVQLATWVIHHAGGP